MVKDFAKRDKKQIAEESQQKLVQKPVMSLHKASRLRDLSTRKPVSESLSGGGGGGGGGGAGGGGKWIATNSIIKNYLTSYRQRKCIYGTNIYV